MSNQLYFLKPNVVIEPLYDQWYAWSHLISPATAAMNIVNRHLTIMDSYLSAPEIHAHAVLNPKMRGGPFMDLGGGRLDEVTELRNKTVERQRHLIDFAKAVKELDVLLMTEAKGFSLEKLYEKVPAILRGYVELFYDRHNNPNFRFFEALLYNSKFWNKSSQSIALWLTANDHRPFCLSTPRLSEDGVINLAIPFDHSGIDDLARLKRHPGTEKHIESLFLIPDQKKELFRSFFTDQAPPKYKTYTGDKIRMRYFGHACVLIETNGVSILVDPLISYYGYPSEVEHYSDIDLPDVIDYVLITHNHQDHILFETLLPLRHKVRHMIVPRTTGGRLEDPDLRIMFESIGFSQVVPIEEMQTIEFSDMSITGLPFTGEHCDLNILAKSCYFLKIGGFKLLFVADSRIIEANIYKHIHGIIGDIDVIFMGMECDGAPLTWLYGPLLTKKIPRDQDGSRRLSGSDCKKGMSLVDVFNPKEVYVYAMGQEPWVEFISSVKYTDESNPIVQSNHLVKACKERGITAERLYGEKELLYERQAEEVQR